VIKVSVLYPQKDGVRFDVEYYLDKHIPMLRAKLGAALTNGAVERGLMGGRPGEQPAFIIMGHLYFESVEAFQAAFGPHAAAIMADIPNYSSVLPTIQISEVLA
jgi:uncharacterized protein (TIGR02118 family)